MIPNQRKNLTHVRLTEKGIICPEVAHALCPPFLFIHTMAFPNYNYNQEDSSFGTRERKCPLGTTSAISTCHDYDPLDNFSIK